MIVQIVAAAAAGVLTGAGADALLRGRDPRSVTVAACGLAGALAGAAIRYIGGTTDVLIVGLSSVVGGLLLAFVARARISARLERDR